MAGRLDVDVFAAGAAIRRVVTRLGVAQAIVALFERPEPAAADVLTATAARLVVVEAVDNPANIGAIVRNAAALGWDGLLLDRGSADPFARRSLRVAMGTAFALPHARVDDVTATVTGARPARRRDVRPDTGPGGSRHRRHRPAAALRGRHRLGAGRPDAGHARRVHRGRAHPARRAASTR